MHFLPIHQMAGFGSDYYLNIDNFRDGSETFQRTFCCFNDFFGDLDVLGS